MPNKEAADAYYRKHILPEVEAFHAEHPLHWALNEAELMDEARRQLAYAAFDRNIIRGESLNNQPKEEPTQTFEDATNIWKQRPDLDPTEKISIEGERYLESIKWVFDNAKTTLIKSEGEDLIESPEIAGMPLEDYLLMLKERIHDVEEFSYIVSIVTQLQSLLKTIQCELLALSQPVVKPETKQSLLEILEQHQKVSRGQRFPATEKR